MEGEDVRFTIYMIILRVGTYRHMPFFNFYPKYIYINIYDIIISNNDDIGDPAPSTSNVSDRKLSGKNPAPSNNSADGVQGNRFIDMDILAPVFHIFPCPNCFKKTLKLVETYRYGLACKFEIFCQECQWNYSFLNTKKTKRCYQIIRRAYYTMRRVGGGHERLKRFFFLMNHPPPVNENNYCKITCCKCCC